MHEEAQQIRPNSWLEQLTPALTGFPVNVYGVCTDEDQENDEQPQPAVHYNGQWHQLLWSNTKQRFGLGHPRPLYSQWDIEPDPAPLNPKNDTTDSDSSDSVNARIRTTNVSFTQPVMLTTQTQTTQTQASLIPPGTTSNPPPVNPPPQGAQLVTAADLQNMFDRALRCNPGGGGSSPGAPGGPGGGGPGGPGRPGGPGGGAPPPIAPNAFQPVAGAGGDIKMMGQPPPVFYGDRTKADEFLDQVEGYLRLNRNVAGFNLPIKKVAFTLSHIQGAETAGWKRDMGRLLDTLDPVTDNVPALWDQFLLEFRMQYQDTQCHNRARAQIETHRMKFPDIDQYILSFEELAWQAGYTQGDDATTHYFVKGLVPLVLIDIYKPPVPHTYAEIKQRAIDSTHSRMLIDDILGKRQGPSRGPPPPPHPFGRLPGQNCPFFSQNNPQPRGPPSAPQYNSTNTPRWMNNVPVLMDLSRARALTWRGNRNNAFRHATQAQRPLICFQCGKEGHFAHNCRDSLLL